MCPKYEANFTTAGKHHNWKWEVGTTGSLALSTYQVDIFTLPLSLEFDCWTIYLPHPTNEQAVQTLKQSLSLVISLYFMLKQFILQCFKLPYITPVKLINQFAVCVMSKAVQISIKCQFLKLILLLSTTTHRVFC